MKIREYMRIKDKIDLNPAFQRGPAWQPNRQVLLIDSILRGMDIPKVYLRHRPNNPYPYEAVDGQQRLKAIRAFREGTLPLQHGEPLPAIDGDVLVGLRYSELSRRLRDRFDDFEISVVDLLDASVDEVSAMFSRLQMGVALNPAELRNAQLGPLNAVITAIAEDHRFFAESRISRQRYKWRDYTALAFAVLLHDGERGVKAPDLKNMLDDFGPGQSEAILKAASRVGDALTVLADVNALLGGSITQKWIYLDLVWLIAQRIGEGRAVDASKLADAFAEFERLRRQHTAAPEVLIGRGKRGRMRRLYDYIIAFKSDGGLSKSLKTRNQVIKLFLDDIDVGP